MKHHNTDVLIIGAGASGGVVARRLSQAGLSVRILEQGQWPDRGAFRGAEDDWELTYRKQWSADPCIRKRPEDYPINSDDADITPLMFNGVGGGTIIYNGTWPRMLPSDFRTRSLDGVGDDWPVSYNELKPFYDRTDADFGVSGLGGDPFFPDEIDYPLPPLPLGKAGRTVAEGLNKLGWHWWLEPNAILSRSYDGRRPCVQRGTCTSGCGEGAKASTDLTHFPYAIRDGAELITGARVVRIEHDENGLATGATYMTSDGADHFAGASIVILAANAIGTPRLLLMSASNTFPDGLANRSGLVGKRLMMHTFSVVTGYFEQSLGTWQGHFGASITSYEFYETDARRGFARGAKWALSPVGGPLGHVLPQRAGQAVWGPAHHVDMLARFGHGASWAIFGEDLPEETNHVSLDPSLTDTSGLPAPKVSYTLAKNSIDLTHFHVDRAVESMEAAGARAVTRDVLLPHSGWHLMGTARMGDDPQNSVVNRWSQCHDIANLFIVDASQFVTSSGVNPTSTIAALALRAADHIVTSRSKIPVPA